MFKVTFIDEADAPAIPAKNTYAVSEAIMFASGIVPKLSAGNVAKIALDESDNVRSLKRAFTSVGKKHGKNISSDVQEGVLYVRCMA